MKIVIDPNEPGWKLDEKDVEVVKTLPDIIKAMTPMVLGIAVLLLTVILASKGYHPPSIGSLLVALKGLWPK